MDGEESVVAAVHEAESAVADAIQETRESVESSTDDGHAAVMGEMKTRLAAIETSLSELNTTLRAIVESHKADEAPTAQETTTEATEGAESAAEAVVEDHTETTEKPRGSHKRYPGRKKRR